MKVHWGTAVIAVFLLFAGGIGLLVTISMRQHVDLVSDNYYQLELQHEQRIEETKRSASLAEQVSVDVRNPVLLVKFPAIFKQEYLIGTLMVYRPSDRTQDIILPIRLDSNNIQVIQTSSLTRGLWRLKMEWEYLKEKYYQEESVILE